MNIIRVKQIWSVERSGTYLSKEGMEATAGMAPCVVDTKTIVGDDGDRFEASIFVEATGAAKRFSAPVCLIPADAPAWAEEAIAKLVPNPYPNRG